MAGKFNLTDLLNQRSKEEDQTAAGMEPQQEKEMMDATEKEEIIMVDVYDLIPSKDNFYRVDSDLKRSIALVGVLQPLLIKKPENGKYRVIAGHRRRLAVLALVEEGNEERRFVPCIFKKADVRDRLALIMANKFRDKTDWEKMQEAIEAEMLAKELKDEHKLQGRTRELLAEITGVSEAQLGRYKAIYNNLHPLLMEEFKADRIGFSVVSEACGMSEEWQQRAAELFMENEVLTLADIKELKKQEEAARPIPGQMNMADIEQEEAEDPQLDPEETPEQQPEEPAQPEYVEPQPDTVTSLCYSCDNYENCHEKKETVTSCNAYVDRKEARKTDEQRYNEEQAAIDRDTKRKLQEQQDAKKMENLPSDEEKAREMRLPASRYDDISTGIQTFLLLKNDKFKIGEEITLQEYADGEATGRNTGIEIIFILEDYTGLEDGYCILGFNVTDYDI